MGKACQKSKFDSKFSRRGRAEIAMAINVLVSGIFLYNYARFCIYLKFPIIKSGWGGGVEAGRKEERGGGEHL